MTSPTSEQEQARWLEEIIIDATYGTEDDGLGIISFVEAGLLTADEGLVICFPNCAKFQLTIVRSR